MNIKASSTLAAQDHIELYERIASKFLQDILGLNLQDCLITDESSLSDFGGCGLPDSLSSPEQTLNEYYDCWDAWVVPKICDKYGLEPFEPNIKLVELFRRIEMRAATSIH